VKLASILPFGLAAVGVLSLTKGQTLVGLVGLAGAIVAWQQQQQGPVYDPTTGLPVTGGVFTPGGSSGRI